MPDFNASVSFKNRLLANNDIDTLSLHSADPGDTGDNEVSGNGYSRQDADWALVANGVQQLASGNSWPVPAGPVLYVGGWHGATWRGSWQLGPDDRQVFTGPGTYSTSAGQLGIA